MKKIASAIAALFAIALSAFAGNYDNFKVSVYTRAYEVEKMSDPEWLETTWNTISSQLKVDKIYLETHRDTRIVPQSTLDAAKKFFKAHGVEVAGGITYTISEANNFQTYCYTTPEDRAMVQKIAEYTAANFDEFILDDFFFTNCKCDNCIEAKGDMEWDEFRVKLMTEAGRNLVINPAKKVNPNVKVIIKYPNWYDDFQGLGFDLEHGPQIFDGVWTGTETRDPSGAQHLQNYESYGIIRYFENLRPGHNGGGWVDSGGIRMGSWRYNEQLWLTMFAKAPEMALFDYRQLVGVKIPEEPQSDKTIATLCDGVFTAIDKFIGKLGNPIGIQSYKVFNTEGEDFLQNWLGMAGMPMDIRPDFPEGKKVVLLTEQAKGDPELKSKIDRQLRGGGTVVVTSGLLKAAPDVIGQFAQLRVEGDVLVNDFGRYGKSEKDILIPRVRYFTNDTWDVISAGRPLSGGTNGFPLLLRGKYSEGMLYVLNIPEDFSDLYALPDGVLNQLRSILSADLKVRIEGPAKVSLFVYDNDTFIVESFLDEPVSIKVVSDKEYSGIENILTGKTIEAESGNRYSLTLEPHTYQVFRLNKPESFFADQNNWFHTEEAVNDGYADVLYFVSTNVFKSFDEEGNHSFRAVLGEDERKAMSREMAKVYETVFKDSLNFFSPYYHQTTFDAINLPKPDFDLIMGETGAECLDAFNYYMENMNGGRPFILAGFSQGAMFVKSILKNMTDEQYRGMVAAYVIGYELTSEDLDCPHIVAAGNATDTGVTISYNSVCSVDSIWPMVYSAPATCINPVNWRTDATPAPLVYGDLSLSVAVDPAYNVVVVTGYGDNLPKAKFEAPWPEGNLHHEEILIYAESLGRNALDRVNSRR
ncbi:MAG: DUF3089 domain-containing protein [Bacteroidia bacterium]|nr:DUF3089 domain-containing protein [Bacteroidia bacterium]